MVLGKLNKEGSDGRDMSRNGTGERSKNILIGKRKKSGEFEV
jgi:hypothetical protein